MSVIHITLCPDAHCEHAHCIAAVRWSKGRNAKLERARQEAIVKRKVREELEDQVDQQEFLRYIISIGNTYGSDDPGPSAA